MKSDIRYPTYYSRRSFLRLGALGLVGGALVIACGDEDRDGNGAPSTPVPEVGGDGNGGGPTELKLINGWYRDRPVQYYDLGTNTKLAQGSSVAVAPIYAFFTGARCAGKPPVGPGPG